MRSLGPDKAHASRTDASMSLRASGGTQAKSRASGGNMASR